MSSWTQLSQFLRFFLPTFEFSLKIFSQVNEESGGGGGVQKGVFWPPTK